MKKLLFLGCVLSALSVAAQAPAPKEKAEYYAAVQAGLLEGGSQSAFMVQLVNGVTYRGWTAGLGVGLDKYRERSIPLFVAIRRSLLKKVPLYLYADGGINMLWPLPEERQWQAWENRNNKPGLYLDGGLQYQFRIRSKSAFLLSAGYSEKRYSWQTVSPFCLDGTCPSQVNSWHYTFRRIAIKAGWKF